MKSQLAQKLNSRFAPVAMLRADTLPADAIEPEAGPNRCMMDLFARAVAEGRTVALSRETTTCAGAVTGLGFGNGYTATPADLERYSAFFAKGTPSARDPQAYQAFVDKLKDPHTQRKFQDGERLFVEPEDARHWVTEGLPIYDLPGRYVIFKPLAALAPEEQPQSVIFMVNPLEVTALLMVYGALPGGTKMAVTPTPQSSGCQVLGSQIFHQIEPADPAPVLGYFDLAARHFLRPQIPDESIAFSLPWSLFLKMDAQADYVLESCVWTDLQTQAGA